MTVVKGALRAVPTNAWKSRTQNKRVARMERSAIRDPLIRIGGAPDYASLHPGYDRDWNELRTL
jgi:hypothetical protein